MTDKQTIKTEGLHTTAVLRNGGCSGKLKVSFSNQLLWRVDSLVLRNPPLRKAAKRCAPCGRTKKSYATGDNVNGTDSFPRTITADFKPIKFWVHTANARQESFKFTFTDQETISASADNLGLKSKKTMNSPTRRVLQPVDKSSFRGEFRNFPPARVDTVQSVYNGGLRPGFKTKFSTVD